ncbi:MAG TPA: DUF2520 domain-containing protein [Actinomycetota bacterium]|nr:DUF2520 domain-containing protein [Actinomycetota bacterium]
MATTPPSPFTFVLVGAGRVGTAVGELLVRAGHEPLGVSSRSHERRDAAAARFQVPVVEPDRLPPSDVVLLGVPDAALAEVAGVVAPALRPGTVVIHFSGTSGIRPLAAAVVAGARACALHPVQACPDVDTAITRLPGSYWGVTTTTEARDWAIALVRDGLAGTPVEVREADRPVWHAAAVTASNGIAGLMAVGEHLLRSIGVAEPDEVLGPLARGTVENAIDGGGGGLTLTGPAVRGEHNTFVRHLDALARTAPQLVAGYTLAARLVLEAAGLEGRIDTDAATRLLALLEEPR